MASSPSPFDPSDFRHVRKGSPTGRGGKYQAAGVVYHGKESRTFGSLRVKPGEKISRRQFENLRYQAGGWKSKSEYERAIHSKLPGKHESRAFIRWMEIYAEEHDVPERKVAGPDSEYSRAFVQAYRDGFPSDPNGSLSHLLTVIGLRDEQDVWDVGDSPSSS